MYTVTEGSTAITGRIDNMDDITAIKLLVNGNEVPFEADGTFTHNYTLTSGTNYIEVKVMKNDIEQDVRHLAVFARPDFSPEKKSFSGWTRLPMSESLKRARMFWHSCKSQETGVTSVAFDVKGVEGYVSYKKNDLTGRPYVSEIKAPEKQAQVRIWTYCRSLLIMVTHWIRDSCGDQRVCRRIDCHNEYAVLNDHLDWEERVYFAENNGEIKRLRESKSRAW